MMSVSEDGKLASACANASAGEVTRRAFWCRRGNHAPQSSGAELAVDRLLVRLLSSDIPVDLW